MMINENMPLIHLPMKKNFRAGRVSSYDATGGNEDWWVIKAGEAKTIAKLEGPGSISHIWFTINSDDRYFLRKLLLKIYWDGESHPSICVPVGDFFGLGHGKGYTYECAAFSCTACLEGNTGGRIAMNCWLPMPFAKSAHVVIENEQECDVKQFYFYIDYQIFNSFPENMFYLHAQWRRENPCVGEPEPEGKNLTGKSNYLLFEAEGQGHYIGMNMSIDNLTTGEWWGEGDDMFFIDRDGTREWPPDLHGTGSEDYLCHAWGMQKAAHCYCGQPYTAEPDYNYGGKIVVYRHHIADPIPFEKNICFSIEHGHANDQNNDYASTAYWYQSEPHKEFGILPVCERIPR